MNSENKHDIDDVGEAIRENRPLHAARGYRIKIAQGDLNFRPVVVDDPFPLGRQILEASGFDSRRDYSLFAILPSGDFEDVRLDEKMDLCVRGAERFVAFQTDRTFKLILDGRQVEWGKPILSGAVLYKLGNVSGDQAAFLSVPGGCDKLVEPTDLIDLNAPGVEKFVVAAKPPKTYEIVVNSRTEIVSKEKVTYEQVVQLAFPGAHGPTVVFAVTYRHAQSNPPAGELAAGGSVLVKHKGTIFNVTKTDKS
jgi:hypothetical protein